jgi:lipid-binding SYLF domain-containing protein
MSFMQKVQATAKRVGNQATAFSKDLSQFATEGGNQIKTGFKFEGECQKAAKTLQSFLADPDHPESALNSIPKAVLTRASGLAIFTVLKAGFVWSGKAGSGVVIARLPDGTWSAPSCIATGGVGFGLQIGADLSEFVVVLNSEDAVKAFATTGNLTVGGNLAAAAGPIGTGGAVNASLLHPAPLFTYSKNRGLFAGISLEGTALIERKDANEAFYGQRIPSIDILTGKVPPPEAASALYDIIETAEQVDESGLPQQAYIPTPAAPAAGTPPPPVGSPAAATVGKEPLFDASGAH